VRRRGRDGGQDAVGLSRARLRARVRVEIKDGPIAGLTARAVFVVGKDGKVKHVEYVKEIGSEPNYDAALAAAKSATS